MNNVPTHVVIENFSDLKHNINYFSIIIHSSHWMNLLSCHSGGCIASYIIIFLCSENSLITVQTTELQLKHNTVTYHNLS